MRAMQFISTGEPLRLTEVPPPTATEDQLLLTVEACAVCRTDLHLIDGEVAIADPPRTLGHQIVGTDEHGDRFGVSWLGWTCGTCSFCTTGRENLCPNAKFTGCDIDGGFADKAVADRRYAFPLPKDQPAEQLAPLLCAGLIGYRCLSFCGQAQNLGIYGFGAAAHVITQVAVHQQRSVFAFTRPGDAAAQAKAKELGVTWAGDSEQQPPEPLDAAIIFAPVGELVPLALKATKPGGIVVCGGIHMSDIPSFPYELLWHERTIKSVANLTRRDGEEFLPLAAEIPIRTEVTTYPLEQTNQALDDLRNGRFTGSAVIVL
ncbi:MAG: zinc-dependent alcohol dehydrogenase family protein [Solirubrobacterales bacterium]